MAPKQSPCDTQYRLERRSGHDPMLRAPIKFPWRPWFDAMKQQLTRMVDNPFTLHNSMASSKHIGLGESACSTSILRVAKNSWVKCVNSCVAVESSSPHFGSYTQQCINSWAPLPMNSLTSDQ